jgi:5'(3')-deoxyribonucleotidase
VTTPTHSEFWHYERVEWLNKHFGFKPEEIIFAYVKHVINSDFIIDDKTETIIEWAQYHPDGLAILWNMTYNQTDEAYTKIIDSNLENIARVYSWDGVLKLVEIHL